MKPLNGYEGARAYTEGEKLPAGIGVILDIKNVKYREGAVSEQTGERYSDTIVLAVDIAEGEYKDFYKRKFDADTSEDKKWKGTIRIYVPKDDGSEKDGWTQNRFRTVVQAIEDSNPGYSWDWDETKWKGKKLGCLTGAVRTIIDGKAIDYTELSDRGVRSVKAIKSGNLSPLKLTYRKCTEQAWNATASGQQYSRPESNDFVDISGAIEEEIPF